jgi:hypothetical protein
LNFISEIDGNKNFSIENCTWMSSRRSSYNRRARGSHKFSSKGSRERFVDEMKQRVSRTAQSRLRLNHLEALVTSLTEKVELLTMTTAQQQVEIAHLQRKVARLEAAAASPPPPPAPAPAPVPVVMHSDRKEQKVEEA